MPTVSVIIPTYKHRDFILATLDSVFAQTFTDYEVIVVNDGSPDDTADILKPLAEAGRIRYIEQENQGQGAARNRGIAEAQGDYIALLDDDDLWPPDKLEWQVEQIAAHPDAVLVYGCEAPRGEETESTRIGLGVSGNVEILFRTENIISSPGQTLIRKDALNQVGLFDPNLWGSDDWDLYIRLSSIGSFVYVPRISLDYRLHAENASKDIWRMYQNASLLAAKQEVFGKAELKHLSSKLRRNIADNYSNQFVQMVLRDQSMTLKAACKLLGKAIRVKPTAFRDRCFLAAVASLLFKNRSQYDQIKRLIHCTVFSRRLNQASTQAREK